MPPVYGSPNYNFYDSQEVWSEETEDDEGYQATNLTEIAFWYMMVLIGMLLLWLLMFFLLRIISLRQKTRNPPPRRMYVGSRQRQSLTPQEPTIYVSPSNLPPPPKYECMAPPSYEEVVGVHYPNYQIQPITQPINAALAHGSSTTTNNVVVTTVNETEPVSVTVAAEPRRTSVTVTRS